MIYCIVNYYLITYGGINMEPKKLYRSKTNRMICGVCGGIAEYFNVDANLVRLIAVVLGLSGTGILAYIIAAVILPEQE